jgi:uncharacterized membrane protein
MVKEKVTMMTQKCSTCGLERLKKNLISSDLINPEMVEFIRESKSDWDGRDVCIKCLDTFRNNWIEKLLLREKGELNRLEKEVVLRFKEEANISENININIDKNLSLSEKLSDKLADFGGSWTFILSFLLMIAGWIIFNMAISSDFEFDPYPFILLNLILSCMASLQAPIIMMSQNRQEEKDRMRNEHDYQVNLKAELEIRELHLKIDQLMTQHWQRLIEIQEIQIEILNEQTKLLRKD